MTSAPTTPDAAKTTPAPDLKYFRERYPLTVANFGALGERENYLRRIWRTETRWRETLESQQRAAREAVVRGAPPAGLSVEGEFEIIYAGGVLGLLHAAVLASNFKRRVMVFGAGAVGREGGGRAWNLCDEELGEFERAGLFTKAEIESSVLNRYRSGFVKFHDAASRVKTPPLWMENVLDVSVDADRLLGLAAAKIRARAAEGCALFENLRFVRAYVEADRVCVETEDTRGDGDTAAGGGARKKRLFAARLFVDATGAHSPVARQFDGGRAFTHVAPSVGTVARGFARGEGADKVDFKVGEILVSTEDVRDHRQLIWEGFAGSPARDEYATRLFFYDAVDSPADKSLLALFERYFEGLPRYKRAGAQWRVGRPLFGYAPGVSRRGWPKTRPRMAEDRVMLAGDAAGVISPLAFSGPGAGVRQLRRLTHLTDLALAADLLDARALSEINAPAPRVPQMSGLAEFLRPAPQGQPANVNETLNAVMAALHELDVRVRRELFQDRMSFGALKSLLGRTAKLYPRIFQRVREHLGARGTFWWLANIAEAAFSERRGRGAAGEEIDDGESAPAAPAEEFARYVALYRKD
jgi:lycopene cyclase CruA